MRITAAGRTENFLKEYGYRRTACWSLKGVNYYEQFGKWTDESIYFVTGKRAMRLSGVKGYPEQKDPMCDGDREQ